LCVVVSVSGGTLSKGSREYRTPPAVAPPQVPSHYAPNYPIGHARRSVERGPGYSTLPMAPNQHQAMSPPQIGMVHPMNVNQQQLQNQHPQTPPPPPPPGNMGSYIGSDHHMSMPREYTRWRPQNIFDSRLSQHRISDI
jgi:abl interactor 2